MLFRHPFDYRYVAFCDPRPGIGGLVARSLSRDAPEPMPLADASMWRQLLGHPASGLIDSPSEWRYGRHGW
jgi:hypothetical protein